MEVKDIDIDQIERHENSRAKTGDLTELMESIKKEGLLAPLILAPNFNKKSKKKYILVAGNRRYDAMRKLGRTTVKCYINDKVTNEKDMMVINLTENIQRKSVTPYEEGRFMNKLIHSHQMTERELASRLEVAVSYVRNSLNAFENTPPEFRDSVVYAGTKKNLTNQVPLSVATKINSMGKSLTADEKTRLYQMAKRNEINEVGVKLVGYSVAKGVPLNQALKFQSNVTRVRFDISLSKHQSKDLLKRYKNMSLQQILTHIVRGEIKEKIVDPFKDVAKYVEAKQLDFVDELNPPKTKRKKKVRS